MNVLKIILVVFCFSILTLIPVCALEPISGISAGLAVIISALVSNFRDMKSYFSESCDARWVNQNISGLKPFIVIVFTAFFKLLFYFAHPGF